MVRGVASKYFTGCAKHKRCKNSPLKLNQGNCQRSPVLLPLGYRQQPQTMQYASKGYQWPDCWRN